MSNGILGLNGIIPNNSSAENFGEIKSSSGTKTQYFVSINFDTSKTFFEKKVSSLKCLNNTLFFII